KTPSSSTTSATRTPRTATRKTRSPRGRSRCRSIRTPTASSRRSRTRSRGSAVRRASAPKPLSSALVLLLLAGCAIAPPTPRAPIDAEARRVVDRLTAGWQEFHDLRALADVSLKRGSERQRLSGVLLARAPASVRFEALSPFGQPFLLVTITGGRTEATVTFQRGGDGALTGFDLTAGNGYATGAVRYRSLSLNAGVDAERFALTLPKDAKINSIR